MRQTEKQCWEGKRAEGEARFVLREGLLHRGLPFATFVVLGRLLYDVFMHRPVELTWKLAVMFAFYAVAFGGVMGAKAWRDREKDYQKPTEDEDVDQPDASANAGITSRLQSKVFGPAWLR